MLLSNNQLLAEYFCDTFVNTFFSPEAIAATYGHTLCLKYSVPKSQSKLCEFPDEQSLSVPSTYNKTQYRTPLMESCQIFFFLLLLYFPVDIRLSSKETLD